MVAIALHVSRDAAVKSGLFGLLGDAPVRMIDVGANTRLEEYDIFYNHATERDQEPMVANLFDRFKSGGFQDAVKEWVRNAEQEILMKVWHSYRRSGLTSVEEPDENHPVMKEARRD